MALTYEGMSHPIGTREQFRDHFCDDITLCQLEQHNYPAILENLQYDYGLYVRKYVNSL
jgi:hypothetical protein